MTQAPPLIPGPPLKPHRGTTVLVLGICSLVIGGCGIGIILGIVAWVMGNDDLREMDAGRMDPSGRDATQAGRICGMVSVGLAAVGILVGILYFGVFGLFLAGAAARGP